MKPQHELVWFSTRKNKKRTTYNIAWGHSPNLRGWDLLMWQRTCEEFCVSQRLMDMANYYRDAVPGDFDSGIVSMAAESGECLHCPDYLVERVRDIVVETQDYFLRTYYVGAHND